MLTSVKLVNGAHETILLPRQDEGVRLQNLDAPSPGVREVVDDRTDDDGTRDETATFGARACTIDLMLTKDARAIEDELARYLHPMLRPYLVVADDGWGQVRRLRLRSDQWSAPLTTDLAPDQRKVQLQWKCPDGIWEAADELAETVDVDTTADVGGTSLPMTLPMTFSATSMTGAHNVSNPGAIPSHMVVRLYGPCTGPVLINETTDERLVFTSGLSLEAGQYVEIDTREQTAFAQGDEAITRLNHIDFTANSWWRLEPGDNSIRYAPSDADAGAQAVLIYRPAWL